MRYRCIPCTDLSVSEICLGTAGLGGSIDREASFRLLDRFLELGGTFLDTAKVYADWMPGERSSSEKTIGRWLAARHNRQRVVLATKGAHPDLATMHIPRLSPAEIRNDLEDSLRHLGVDTIDLYWLHADDQTRPVSEILETLVAQVRAGKIRYFGASNWCTARLVETQAYAAAHEFLGFCASQVLWNYGRPERDAVPDETAVVMDAEMWQYHAHTGLSAIPYSSQAHGLFHRMAAGTLEQMNPGTRAFYSQPETARRFERLQKIRRETGLSVTQVVLGYLLSQPFTTVPIVGCHSPEQVDDSLTAAGVRLTPAQMEYLG